MQYSNKDKKINIAFFGSSDFSVSVLSELLKVSNIKIHTIVTKKDKKIGRGSNIHQNTVATFALKNGLNVVKVGSLLKNPDQLGDLLIGIDYAVVVSFGFILPQSLLDQLPNRFINLHTSLLPKYRGASPIHSAIINGDTVTGNSTMILDDKMDEGPILKTEEFKLDLNQTAIDIFPALAKAGSKLLIDTLLELQRGTIKPQSQDASKATYASLIKKEDGYVSLNEMSADIYNKYRAYVQWPGVYTYVKDLEKFLDITTKIMDKDTVIKLKKLSLDNDKLHIEYVQLPNKPSISLVDFYNGYVG